MKWAGVVAILAVSVCALGALRPSGALGFQAVNSMSASEVPKVTEYWTPGRLAEASGVEPRIVRTKKGLRRILVEISKVSSPNLLRNRPVSPLDPAVGRLFVSVGRRGSWSCSASVLDTPSRRLVVTAAHCLSDQYGLARNVAFVPAYHYGIKPFGLWTASKLGVTRLWENSRFPNGVNGDVGVIETRRSSAGETIGQVTGTLGFQTFSRRSGRVRILGYPVGTYKGQELRECRSSTFPGDWISRRLHGPVGVIARCNMAKGSSGGPWLSAYNGPDGETVWLIDGVTSRGSRGGNLTSSYFGSQVRALIRRMEH